MPPYRKRFSKRRFSRSRSKSRGRRPLGGSFMKRARTRAYANIRTGGLLAIERKFSDLAYPATLLSYSPAGVDPNAGGPPATGSQGTWAPPVLSASIYRSAIGTIVTTNCAALNVLGTGDSGSDRDGRQVINDSIHLRGCVTYAANDFGALDTCCAINIVVVLDTQTNGAAPTGGLVFVNPGDSNVVDAGGAVTSLVSGNSPFVNLSNSKRFRILKHIRRIIVPGAICGNGVLNYPSGGFIFAMDIPLKGMKTNYVSDTAMPGATVASIGDNGVFLFAWSDFPNRFLINFNSRLRFRG